MATAPPNRTAPTGPRKRAATPLSNSPSSFDAEMKMNETDVTRPFISSGVASWIREALT